MLSLCVIMCLLCGCTRREQLILRTEGTQALAEAEGTGYDGSPDGDVPYEDNLATEGSEKNTADPVKEGTSGEEIQGHLAGQPQQASQADASTVIYVHVCGAVEHAGVYELPAGSRVFEAVKEAGGFAPEADEGYVNQAQRLTDGDKLVIPTVEQVQNAVEDTGNDAEQIGIVEQAGTGQAALYGVSAGADGQAAEADAVTDGKININTATEAQLCEIPGIGATRASAIVAYRQESGGFNSIEDIMKVSGIKEGTYAKIKDSIKVN